MNIAIRENLQSAQSLVGKVSPVTGSSARGLSGERSGGFDYRRGVAG